MIMNSILGVYAAKGSVRILCGVSGFYLKAGARVSVEQIDRDNKKALVRYGYRDIDWMPLSILERDFERVGE